MLFGDYKRLCDEVIKNNADVHIYMEKTVSYTMQNFQMLTSNRQPPARIVQYYACGEMEHYKKYYSIRNVLADTDMRNIELRPSRHDKYSEKNSPRQARAVV